MWYPKLPHFRHLHNRIVSLGPRNRNLTHKIGIDCGELMFIRAPEETQPSTVPPETLQRVSSAVIQIFVCLFVFPCAVLQAFAQISKLFPIPVQDHAAHTAKAKQEHNHEGCRPAIVPGWRGDRRLRRCGCRCMYVRRWCGSRRRGRRWRWRRRG